MFNNNNKIHKMQTKKSPGTSGTVESSFCLELSSRGQAYLCVWQHRALWMACGAAAAAAGGKVVLQRDHVTSLADLERQHGPWAAVVVAAGAAAAALPEVGGQSPRHTGQTLMLELQLQQSD